MCVFLDVRFPYPKPSFPLPIPLSPPLPFVAFFFYRCGCLEVFRSVRMYVCTLGGMYGRKYIIGVRGCCSTAEGRALQRAVRCCRAGAYVSGDWGSNACPAGSARIETEAACRTAAAAAGKTPSASTSYPFVQTFATSPRGCYYYTTDNAAFFNAHAVGAGNSGQQLLCAATVTTGAPLTRRLTCTACVLHGASGRRA